MIKEIIKYPNPSIKRISGNVRFFNNELEEWITDMTDTMKTHDLHALSAILIGIQYCIIVVKEEDAYVPYINARIIKHSGKSTATERSVYYDGISVDVDRYDKITARYEDERGESHHRDFEGDEAREFQQQLDYCFGSTFVDRVEKEVKKRINKRLEFGLVKDANGGSCPTVFYRDYFRKGASYTKRLAALTFVVPFFGHRGLRSAVYTADLYALALSAFLIIGYIITARIETVKYKQCTSCQTGNIIGTSAILGMKLSIAAAIVFLWVRL